MPVRYMVVVGFDHLQCNCYELLDTVELVYGVINYPTRTKNTGNCVVLSIYIMQLLTG
jgi:hypothetical protein